MRVGCSFASRFRNRVRISGVGGGGLAKQNAPENEGDESETAGSMAALGAGGAAEGAPEGDDAENDGGHADDADIAGAGIAIGELAHSSGLGDDFVKPIIVHFIVQPPVTEGDGDATKGFALEGEILGEGFGLGPERRHSAEFGDPIVIGPRMGSEKRFMRKIRISGNAKKVRAIPAAKGRKTLQTRLNQSAGIFAAGRENAYRESLGSGKSESAGVAGGGTTDCRSQGALSVSGGRSVRRGRTGGRFHPRRHG